MCEYSQGLLSLLRICRKCCFEQCVSDTVTYLLMELVITCAEEKMLFKGYNLHLTAHHLLRVWDDCKREANCNHYRLFLGYDEQIFTSRGVFLSYPIFFNNTRCPCCPLVRDFTCLSSQSPVSMFLSFCTGGWNRLLLVYVLSHICCAAGI